MDLWLVALAGFSASLVDGALGMGFGPTSSSVLLAGGMSPVGTSATVNLAKVATGVAAGISHWRFDNIDRRLVLRLAVPGVFGAAFGATVLANVDSDSLRPLLALMLLAVGLRIMVRFSRHLEPTPSTGRTDSSSGRRVRLAADADVIAAGSIGGITNGLVGAWGPVVTPVMLQRGVEPRIAVGSVNTAEVAVAAVSVGSLIGSLGGSGLDIGVIGAMLTGGVIAAPLGAYAVRFVPARLLGLGVALVLLITQIRELDRTVELPLSRWLLYALAAASVAFAIARPLLAGAATRPKQDLAPSDHRGNQESASSTIERTAGGN